MGFIAIAFFCLSGYLYCENRRIMKRNNELTQALIMIEILLKEGNEGEDNDG